MTCFAGIARHQSVYRFRQMGLACTSIIWPHHFFAQTDVNMAKDRAKAAQDAGFDAEDLEWISSLRHDINEHQETAREKFMRKLKSNPLVPIGKTQGADGSPRQSGAPHPSLVCIT